MSRVIVTGGAGFIGSHLVDALVQQRHQVTVVDDLSTGRTENLPAGPKFIQADIRSSRLKNIWRDTRPEFVFHFAAQKNVQTSLIDPLFDADVNISGSLNIIELSRQSQVKKFIFSSSGGAIYGNDVRLPTPETASPKPESPYGIAKFTIEQYLNYYRKYRGLPSVSLRYANVYGPRQDPRGEAGVVAIFAKNLLQQRPLLINGNGRQTRDYVYVADVVQANIQAMKRAGAAGELNIGTGRQVSVNDLAKKMARVAKVKITTKKKSPVPGELQRSALHPGRSAKELHWKASTKLETGLALTWAWAKEAL